jgi:hypothetical protein
MTEKDMLRMTAAMEGEQTVLARIGNKVKLSEMELICLVNFAEVGVLSTFCSMDGEEADLAERELEKHINAIRKEFSRDQDASGLPRLLQSTIAIIQSDRIRKYLVKS